MDKHSARPEDPEGDDHTRRARVTPKILDRTPWTQQYGIDNKEFNAPAGEPAMIVIEVLAGIRPDILRTRSLKLSMTEDTPASSTATMTFCRFSSYVYVSGGFINVGGDVALVHDIMVARFDLADPDSVHAASNLISNGIERAIEKQKAVVERSGKWVHELEKYGC